MREVSLKKKADRRKNCYLITKRRKIKKGRNESLPPGRITVPPPRENRFYRQPFRNVVHRAYASLCRGGRHQVGAILACAGRNYANEELITPAWGRGEELPILIFR